MSSFYVLLGLEVHMDGSVENIKFIKSFYSHEEAFDYATNYYEDITKKYNDFAIVQVEMPFSPPA